MKGMVVVNPTSGQQMHQQFLKLALNKLLEDKIVEGLYVMYTTGKDSAFNAVSKLTPGEYDFVIAVGGDGTVSEVVNGLIKSKSGIPLAIYPAGTTNDFATSVGLPREIKKVADLIKNHCTVSIDAGKINDKYFLNVAAGGSLSEVAHKVSIGAKTVLGRFAYIAQGIKDIGSLNLKTVKLHYETAEGESFDEDTFFFIAANSRSVGGFSKIAPGAFIDDGLLDVCIVKKLSPVDLVPIYTAIKAGKHVNDSKHINYFRTTKLTVSTVNKNDLFPIDYDGECGSPMPLTIEVIPNAIKLIVPKNGKKIKKITNGQV